MKHHYLIPGVLLLLTTRAYCQSLPHVELSAGMGGYTVVPNGIWYQAGVPREQLRTHGETWTVGLTGPLVADAFSRLDWHIDYVNLGHISSHCYCTSIDDDYDHVTQRIRAGAPMAQYNGTGYVQGIKASLAPYVVIHGYRVGGETGYMLFRPTWRETVYGWSWGGPAQTFTRTTATQPVLARMYGLSIGRGAWTLSYVHYHLPIRQHELAVPPLYTGAHTLQITFIF